MPEPAAAPPDDSQVDLLMGFLADFRAAGREPEPEPEKAPPPQAVAGSSPLSRFDFAPPDPLSDLDLPPAAPLPVWPPVPGSEPAPAPVAAIPQPEGPGTPPEAAGEGGDGGTGKRGINVFRRMGRR